MSQNATDTANNATDAVYLMIKNATKTFNTEVYNFTLKVLDDNVESCLNYSADARNLQYEFLTELDKCSNIVERVNQQIFVNISLNYTLWIQQINYGSNCHDRCVGRYCPFLSFGPNTAVGVCWLLKRILPRIYDSQAIIDGYNQCHSEVRT